MISQEALVLLTAFLGGFVAGWCVRVLSTGLVRYRPEEQGIQMTEQRLAEIVRIETRRRP